MVWERIIYIVQGEEKITWVIILNHNGWELRSVTREINIDIKQKKKIYIDTKLELKDG